jgi:hypothetical protein
MTERSRATLWLIIVWLATSLLVFCLFVSLFLAHYRFPEIAVLDSLLFWAPPGMPALLGLILLARARTRLVGASIVAGSATGFLLILGVVAWWIIHLGVD